ncbi:MAG TPA: hypothetical protein VIM61_14195 [Chthoniobacterales bacterium]|jgi:hypothetical protein
MTPFERRLAATPRRDAPSELRARILAIAREAERPAWRIVLARLLWPHPIAWGALAAAWIAIAALNVAGPRGPELYTVSPPEYRDRLPAAREYFVQWEIERRLLARLEAECTRDLRPVRPLHPALILPRPEDL